MAEHIDTDAKDDTSDVRTHTSCDGWDALRAEATHAPPTVTLTPDRALSMVAEVRRLRAVRDAAQRVVDGDWPDDCLDLWDALGMVLAALEATHD